MLNTKTQCKSGLKINIVIRTTILKSIHRITAPGLLVSAIGHAVDIIK